MHLSRSPSSDSHAIRPGAEDGIADRESLGPRAQKRAASARPLGPRKGNQSTPPPKPTPGGVAFVF